MCEGMPCAKLIFHQCKLMKKHDIYVHLWYILEIFQLWIAFELEINILDLRMARKPMKEKKDKLWPKNKSNKNGFITELAAH